MAHWLHKSGVLHLFDDKPLLLTNFFIFCSPPTLSVENRTSQGIGARRGATLPCPPSPWPCNNVLKPNFQSIIFQTNNGCSLLSLILAKLLLLDISCENIFALFVVTALTARPFSMKKCAKMSVFLYENRKNPLAAGSFIQARSQKFFSGVARWGLHFYYI